MKISSVVVDSNLTVLTVIDSEFSSLAARVWSNLITAGASFFAPGLWAYETTSVIRKYNAFGKITEAEAQEALDVINQMPIQLISDNLRLRQSALSWATRLRQKAAYDGFYLATAELLEGEFWTADHALVNNARQVGAGWAHWMGEIE